MRIGDTVYFIVSGRRIEEATVKRMDWYGVLATTHDGGLRLPRSRFYATKEEAEKHLLPPVPIQKQEEVYAYSARSREIAWRPHE